MNKLVGKRPNIFIYDNSSEINYKIVKDAILKFNFNNKKLIFFFGTGGQINKTNFNFDFDEKFNTNKNMKEFDKLYARNSNGKINSWSIIVGMQANGFALISIEEGILNGKLTHTQQDIKKGKNLGKMNATTPFEQACNEAQSRWEKKKKQGYKSLEDLAIPKEEPRGGITNSLTLEDCLEIALPQNRTDANNISKPMKAQQYFKDNGEVRIKFPCYGQPKLNGFRVMARWEKVIEGEGLFKQEIEKVVFRSKEGLKYDILEHIETEFTKEMFFIASNNGVILEIVYDGEMYMEGEILSEISSAVRKRNARTPYLKFYVFDIAVENMNQKERLLLLNNLLLKRLANIKLVHTIEIKNNEDAQNCTDSWIKEGYEGGIFRDKKATYQFGKRPQTMTKLKRSQDKEFKIIDVIGGDNSPELGIFICLAENGKEFKVNPEGSHEIKKNYLINKKQLIGKRLTVRFFERTKDDLPFHAVGVAVRDYE